MPLNSAADQIKLGVYNILLCDPVAYVEKNGEITQFPLNNTFFASYRDRRLFLRVSETFPQGSWPLILPSLGFGAGERDMGCK